MCHVDQTLKPNSSEYYETDEKIRVLKMMRLYSTYDLSNKTGNLDDLALNPIWQFENHLVYLSMQCIENLGSVGYERSGHHAGIHLGARSCSSLKVRMAADRSRRTR